MADGDNGDNEFAVMYLVDNLLSDSSHPQELKPVTVTPRRGVHLANTKGAPPNVTD